MSDETSEFPFRVWQLFWYICILLVGGLGNGIVLIVIARSKKIQGSSSFNVFIFALALTDLLISLLGVPNYILSTAIFSHPVGNHGDFTCKFFTGYLFPFWLLDVSAFLLVAIMLDRRKAILNPLSTLHGSSLIVNCFIVLGIILLAFIVQLPTVIGIKYSNSHPTVRNFCVYEYKWLEVVLIYVFVFFFETILPVVVMVTSLRQVRQKLLATDDLLKMSMYAYRDDQLYKEKKKIIMSKKIRTIETMKLVVLAYFFCIVPNSVFYMLFQFANVRTLTWNSIGYQLVVLLRFSNSCVNPILYSFHSNEFRKHFRQVFNSVVFTKKLSKLRQSTGERFILDYPKIRLHIHWQYDDLAGLFIFIVGFSLGVQCKI